MSNSYIVYAGSVEELSEVADRVDAYMDRGTGKNEVRYRLTNGQQVGYDTGFINDLALHVLAHDFTVVPN